MDSTIENNKKETEEATENESAGPSTDLPGSIPPKLNVKTGLSKSEHSILQSFKNDKITFTIHQNDESEKIEINKDDTLADIKAFLENCFRLKNTEVDVQTLQTGIETQNVEKTDPKFVTVELQTVSQEVIITNTSPLVIDGKAVSIVAPKKSPISLTGRSDLAISQRDSLASIGSVVCRICMTRGRERLISPCNCKGSLANVHLSCLERWLNQVGRNHCELCGYSYPAIRTPRYTVLQALRLWFGNPRNRSHLQSDCLIFWLLSTVTAGLLAVCIVGTQYFAIEGTKLGKQQDPVAKKEGISHRITETAMNFFMAIVLCGYTVTVYLLWKDHYVMWNRWRRANVNVRLLLAPDANPVPFVPRPGYRVV